MHIEQVLKCIAMCEFKGRKLTNINGRVGFTQWILSAAWCHMRSAIFHAIVTVNFIRLLRIQSQMTTAWGCWAPQYGQNIVKRNSGCLGPKCWKKQPRCWKETNSGMTTDNQFNNKYLPSVQRVHWQGRMGGPGARPGTKHEIKSWVWSLTPHTYSTSERWGTEKGLQIQIIVCCNAFHLKTLLKQLPSQ